MWRERQGLCKSHFVERNWYMFPAKIYPAEIFPRLYRPNILELCRRIKNQNRRPPGRCYSTAPQPSCRLHPNSMCGRPSAPQWHPAEAIFHCCCHRLKKSCQSQQRARWTTTQRSNTAATLPLVECQPCSVHASRAATKHITSVRIGALKSSSLILTCDAKARLHFFVFCVK